MELNKRTKAVGGLLALALAGLVCDRLVSYGPASAGAAPVSQAEPPLPREAPRHSASLASQQQGALSARLKALANAEAVLPERENAFLAPVAWFPPDDEVVQQKQIEAKKARKEHHLRTVLSSEKRGIYAVLVDGKTLQPGVPVTVETEEGKYKLEFVRAWFDEKRVAHALVKVDGEQIELTVGNRDGNKDKDVREADQSGGG